MFVIYVWLVCDVYTVCMFLWYMDGMCVVCYVCAQCVVCVVYIWCVGMVCVWTLRFCVCATYVVSVYGVYEVLCICVICLVSTWMWHMYGMCLCMVYMW